MKKMIGCALVMALVLNLVACGGSVPTWQEQYDLGIRYLSEGNYEEAIIAFNAAIEIEPEHAEAYIGLADAYIGLGDLPQARNSLTGGLEAAEDTDSIKEKLSDVQYEIGKEYLEKEEYEEAIKAFQDAIENNPKNEDAYLGLAEALMEEGKIDEALDALRKAMEEVDDPSDALKDKLSELEQLKDELDTLSGYYSDEKMDAFEDDDISDLVDILSEHEGMSYDGEKLLDGFTGVGMTMLFEGCVYYGELVNGVPIGIGKSMWQGGNYNGEWSDGKPNGAGILTEISDPTVIWEGNWIDGKGNGQFAFTIVGEAKWTPLVEAGEVVPDGRWQDYGEWGLGLVSDEYYGDGEFGVLHGAGGPVVVSGF